MKITSIRILLLLVMITKVEGLENLWESVEPSIHGNIVKKILETCYENQSDSNPIVIIGEFNQIIEKSLAIRINDFQNFERGNEKNRYYPSKASKIIINKDSVEQVRSDLESLKKTKLWNHMAPTFIIGKDVKGIDRRVPELLWLTWEMNIINTIYILDRPSNESRLFMMNPITDYAPYPWRRVRAAKFTNLFVQLIKPNINCENLNYDKTRFLNGHEIKIFFTLHERNGFQRRTYRFHQFPEKKDVNMKIMQAITEALHVNMNIEGSTDTLAEETRLVNGTTDITLYPILIRTAGLVDIFSPHFLSELVAIVKATPEVSTLPKILHFWSLPVLIFAAVALLIFTLILTIKDHDFFSTILDLTRLLIYKPILTNNTSHWFRIYCTTMLIFMIISNGVFQGKIAAFLTTRERVDPIGTIDELAELNYAIYTSFEISDFARASCSKCRFKEVKMKACIDHVLNDSASACVILKEYYEKEYVLLPLDTVKKLVAAEIGALVCRKDWPLYERFNSMIMRLVGSGLIEFWQREKSYVNVRRREAIEAERYSPEYRPVKLYKLMFIFKFLAFGLSISTIVFFGELLVAKCRIYLENISR